ncbi:MAG: helix-turn-helix transcriptional regulator [Candidatus Zambryskibacteria bacterium]
MEKPIVLSKRRMELGISVKEIAHFVGVSTSTIYQWENDRDGISGISLSLRPKVAEFYQIPTSDLEDFCNTFNRRRENFKEALASVRKKQRGPKTGTKNRGRHSVRKVMVRF